MSANSTKNSRGRHSLIHLSLLILSLFLLVGAKECSPIPQFKGATVAEPTSAENSVQQAEIPSPRVQIFYYCWYGTPKQDKMWVHWERADNKPKSPESNDLGSDYYPALGPYSSQDPRVVDQHMKWLEQAGVGVVIVDWWGIGVQFGPWILEDAIPVILKAAQTHGIKVAFIIDQYDGRTASSVAKDIQYLIAKYGHHPAFYRTVRPTLHSDTQEPRPVFYVYAGSLISNKEWRNAIRQLHKDPTLGTPLLLTDALPDDLKRFDEIKKGNFDGYFIYSAPSYYNTLQQDEDFYIRANQAIAKLNAVFIPAVGPGFTAKRATMPESGAANPAEADAEGQTVWLRNHGEMYDYMWNKAIQAEVEAVAISTFNEWHEGTQIEPAKPLSISAAANSDKTGPYKYLDYEGHYGLNAEQASMGYINRTRQWVERYLGIGAEQP